MILRYTYPFCSIGKSAPCGRKNAPGKARRMIIPEGLEAKHFPHRRADETEEARSEASEKKTQLTVST